MAKNVDIIDVMIAVHRGELKASVSNGYFMLENTKSGERVRLNEADAVPVVHGRWLDAPTVAFTEECSVCGFIVFWDAGLPHEYNYCPNCGAKMDLEVE